MSSIQIISPQTRKPGVSTRVEAFCLGDTGSPETGRTVTYALYHSGTGEWWDNVGLVWGVGKTANAMAQIGAVDLPGVYASEFDHHNLDPGDGESYYYLEVTNTNSAGNPAAPTDAKVLEFRHDLASLPVADGPVANPILTLSDLFQALMVYMTQNRVIDDNAKTLTFMQQDGVTPAMVFDLKDAGDAPSVREVFKTERIV